MLGWSVLVGAVLAAPADVSVLLSGVQEIELDEAAIPGPISIFGPEAFAVAVGRSEGVHHAVVAAARAGRGRVVAFGHDAFLASAPLGDTAILLDNAVRWVAGGQPPARVEGIHCDAVGSPTPGPDSAASWRDLLSRVDVLCMGWPPPDVEIDALVSFVEEGGGLIFAGLGWGWAQLNPDRDLRSDYWGNQLSLPFGFAFGGGYLEGLEPSATASVLRSVHAGGALSAITSDDGGAAAQAHGVLGALVEVLQPDEQHFLPRMRALVQERGPIVITAEAPLTVDRPLDRLAIRLAHLSAAEAPASRIEADPSAAVFPGEVEASARRGRVVASVDLSVPGWASTGAYAPPGEVVRLVLPRSVEPGLRVRIGSHTDELWHLPAWRRSPSISHSWPASARRTRVASPHGGLIYVEVPEGRAGSIEVTLEGVVASPRFVLGRTSAADWARSRSAPGPWAELATDRISLTTRSSAVRDLEDPTPILQFWDEALDAYVELGGRPWGPRLERIVPDEQLSVGYMHAGNPIGVHLDQVDRLLDPGALREGWGVWHELGHNQQRPEWTFDGTLEVTCNLFTLFVLEQLTGQRPAEHPMLTGVADEVEQHLANGARFEHWKQEPFVALTMYVQVQDAFGWAPYQEAFAIYRDLPEELRPRDDDDRRDLWLMTLSRAVGRDLGPFFEAWGVPTSPTARASLRDLQAWMPEGSSERGAPAP